MQQLTPQQKKDVYNALRIHYDSLDSMLNHARKISSITRGRSGFCGVSFNKLIPFLERLHNNRLSN